MGDHKKPSHSFQCCTYESAISRLTGKLMITERNKQKMQGYFLLMVDAAFSFNLLWKTTSLLLFPAKIALEKGLGLEMIF